MLLISSLVQVFRRLVAARALSNVEDGGVVNEGDSETVPYRLGNEGLASCSATLKVRASSGERLQRIFEESRRFNLSNPEVSVSSERCLSGVG